MDEYDVGKIFDDMEDELIDSMKRNLAGHELEESTKGFKWEQWQSKKLRSLRQYRARNKKIIDKKMKKLRPLTKSILKQQYLEGSRKVYKEFSSVIKRGLFSLKRTQTGDDFFSGEDNTLNALIKAIDNDFVDASYAALRKMDDVYRRTIYRSQLFAASGTMTVDKAVDMATRDFLRKGIDCITYSDGKQVNISSYAKMATRTANKKAYLIGEGERRKELGEPLVRVSQYLQCSPLCLPWQGKVYIDDVYSRGKITDGDYPLLSTAIKGHLFHPNCRHTLSTYFEGISLDYEPLVEEYSGKYEQALEKARAQRQVRVYKRLGDGSLNKENIKKYHKKEKIWSKKAGD